VGNSNPNGTTALKSDGFELEDTFALTVSEVGLMDKAFAGRKTRPAKR
jgi:hypothetical protein